ncbi:MAG: hypothetical protein SWY16_27155 [Cyanobacteriota bacterium]|nr:hypothetical protein [Cyanobacteriota bacterium]
MEQNAGEHLKVAIQTKFIPDRAVNRLEVDRIYPITIPAIVNFRASIVTILRGALS